MSDLRPKRWLTLNADGATVWEDAGPDRHRLVARNIRAEDARLLIHGGRCVAALEGLKYPDEPGQPLARFCDHAAEPCSRCEAARAALAAVRGG